MRRHSHFTIFIALFAFNASGGERSVNPTLRTFPGYVSKVSCEGKLLVSSIGNDSIIRLEPLPASLGCAVLLKPLAASGRTNLVIETSASSIQVTVEIRAGVPTSQELLLKLKGDHL